MSKYRVKLYKGNYKTRQLAANKDRAIVYLEAHFNSTGRGFWTKADYALGVVANNASPTSIQFAKKFARAIDKEFKEITRVGYTDGVKRGGRGNGNLRRTYMPAIILEPMFVDDPEHCTVIKSEAGQKRMARVLTNCITETFPSGGLIAFSVGHKYKTTRPFDRGAKLIGGGYEADYAEKVLAKAAKMLLRMR